MTTLFTQEINVLNLLYHFTGEFVIFLKTQNGDGFLCSRCRTPGSERRLQTNLLATFPKEKLSVDFGTCCQTLPTNPTFFFPLFQTRWLRILLEKWEKRSKIRREEREGKNSPRAGGRYCMHVHWSTRFVASCSRIFFSSGVKIMLRVRGENGTVVYDYASIRQFYRVTARDTVSPALFFGPLFPSDIHISKICSPTSSCSQIQIQHSFLASLVYHFSLRMSYGSVFNLFFTSSFVIAKWGECWSSPPPEVWNRAGGELLPRSRSSICTATLVKRLKGPEPLKHLLASSSILYVVKLLKAKQT